MRGRSGYFSSAMVMRSSTKDLRPLEVVFPTLPAILITTDSHYTHSLVYDSTEKQAEMHKFQQMQVLDNLPTSYYRATRLEIEFSRVCFL